MKTRRSVTAVDMTAAALGSSDDENGVSEPDGFDSCDEEEYRNNRDPSENGEDSLLKIPRAALLQKTASHPAPRRRPSPAQPTKRPRSHLAQIPVPQPSIMTRSVKRPHSDLAQVPVPQPPITTQPAKVPHSNLAQIPVPLPSTPSSTSPAILSWKTDKDPDTSPPVSRFQPARTPGPQLSSTSTYTPFDLFKLFFPVQTIQTLCQNTNKKAAQNILQGGEYKWTDLNTEDMYKFMGLNLYMAMVKISNIADYWRQDHLFSLPLPPQVMSWDRYWTIIWNLHLSDPDEDVHNDKEKGTSQYDGLFRLKPLMNTLKDACKSFFHPHRELVVHEMIGAPKAQSGVTQNTKLSKLGIKLFGLVDSKSGYTVDFSVYTGKRDIPSGHSLSYDAVMSLVQPGSLGTGYHIYLDSFYSSPKLFRDLHELRFSACGTYRDNRNDCPKPEKNALTKKSEWGSIRWFRDGPIVYIKWMSTKEVSVCSTIHQAHSAEAAQRRMKGSNGTWTQVSASCPTPVMEYYKHASTTGHSYQPARYLSAQHKTMCWYKELFYYFLDIATTNSFILHKELCLAQDKQPMTHRAFMETLTAELCGMPLHAAPDMAHADHFPMPIRYIEMEPIGRTSIGRRRCDRCLMRGVRKDTPWKCGECGVALCIQPDRNCFAAWHDG